MASSSASRKKRKIRMDIDADADKETDTIKKSIIDREEKSDFELDPNAGSLPFFILDAHEEISGANVGNIYLFGKVCER